jgi:RNA polymerase sigma-70 factor (ECF subfamily)
MDDEELMARFYSGDDSAFEALYRRWFKRLHRRLQERYGRVGPEDAEDVAQQVLVRVFLTRGRDSAYEPSRGAFQPWLFMIARNVATDVLSRRARRQAGALGILARGEDERDLAIPDPGQREPVEALEAMEVAGIVEQCVGRLDNDTERDAMRMLLAGHKQGEIAQALGRSDSWVTLTKQKLQQAVASALRGERKDAERGQ